MSKGTQMLMCAGRTDQPRAALRGATGLVVIRSPSYGLQEQFPDGAKIAVLTANNESGYVSTGDRLKVVPRDGGPVSATFVRGDGLGSIVLIGGSLYVSPRRKLWNRSGRHPQQRHGSRARGPEHVGGDRWPDDGQP